MWLGDVPSPPPCAVLGAVSPPQHRVPCWLPCPVPSTVCHAGSPPWHRVPCWMLGPLLSRVARWVLEHWPSLGTNGGCPPPNHGGCSSAMAPVPQAQCWVFAPVLGAPWDGSLVPTPGAEDLLSPTAPAAPACQELHWLRWE